MDGKEEGVAKQNCELLTGVETAKLVSEIYNALGPLNGCHFVEATAVLALAGLKGFTFLVDCTINQDEIEKIDQLNLILEDQGIKIEYFLKDPSQINIINLKGLEYKTKRTRIPGFVPYQSNSGFEGRMEWFRKLDENIVSAQTQGFLSPEIDITVYDQGIQFGYPDQAIIDFEKSLRTGDIQKDLIESDIMFTHPAAQKYQNPVPDFDYDPKKADPEVLEYLERAKQILRDFYSSELYIKIASDPNFLQAREAVEKRHQERITRLFAQYRK